MTTEVQLQQFLAIFQGNTRAAGVNMKTGGHRVDKDKLDFEARAREHFAGGDGLGIIPVKDNGTCRFGAIDIDNHGPGTDGAALDIIKLGRAKADKRFPLVLCQSKSGGIHAYLFTAEPVPAKQMCQLLTQWALELKRYLPTAVFDPAYPKQSDLTPGADGKPRYGNFINLPYHNNDNTPTRVAYDGDNPISLDEFIKLVDKSQVTASWLKEELYGNISEMPPCLQTKMVTGGFQAGERNDGMYQAGVYAKKLAKHTGLNDNFADTMTDLAKRFCTVDPISERELKTITKSLENREYRYKCSLPMFRDVCDSATCKAMPCGITPEESGKTPLFGQLTQYINVDPPVYDLPITVGDVTHDIKRIPHRVLMFYGELLIWIAKQRIMVPPMKPADWNVVLEALFANARLEELPEEVTPLGLLREAVYAFCALADLSEDNSRHPLEILSRGMPCLGQIVNKKVVMFRAADLSKFLLKTKAQIPGTMIDYWFSSAGQIGIFRHQVGTGRSRTTVWYIEVDRLPEPESSPANKQFKSEF